MEPSLTSPLMRRPTARGPGESKPPPIEMAIHPATLAMTSFNAKAMPAPAAPKAAVSPLNRSAAYGHESKRGNEVAGKSYTLADAVARKSNIS
jgi:hypothetical protein